MIKTKKKILALVILVLTFLLINACSTKNETITISDKDQDSVVNINKNDLIIVELEGNPTTGYTWEVSPDSTINLSLQGEPEFVSSSDALGAGGIIKLTFKADGKGNGLLKLIYHRPWEENIPPDKTFSVTVNIH
jgi:inhibitor of cysteine peptidase